MWPPVDFMKETLSIFDKRFLITPADKKNVQTWRATSYYYFDNDLQEGGFFFKGKVLTEILSDV